MLHNYIFIIKAFCTLFVATATPLGAFEEVDSCPFSILVLEKKSYKRLGVGAFFPGAISLGRLVVPFPKILTNLP